MGMEAVAAELKDAATEYRQAEAAKDVLAEVVQPPALKQQFVAYGDRSAPVVEPDVTIKPSPMAELKEELTGPSPELRHVEASADRSAPVVEPGVKLKESPMGALQKEIEAKQADIKGFATTGAQRVAAKDVLAEVAKGSPRGLKHVDDAAGDRSAPVIAPDVTIKPSPMADLKKEITDAPPSLRPRRDSSDRSAPVVEADVAVKLSPMAALQKEIGAKQEGIRSLAASGGVKVLKEGVLDDIAKGSGASLKSAGPAADRSAPVIAQDVEVTPRCARDMARDGPETVRDALRCARDVPEMCPRCARDVPEMCPRWSPEMTRDGPESEPEIARGCVHDQVKPSPMADLKKELAAVEASPALKHVEASADRSAPIIDGSVKVKPSPMPDLVEEIQKSPRGLNPRV